MELATTTLAESLLNDLDDLSDGEEEEEATTTITATSTTRDEGKSNYEGTSDQHPKSGENPFVDNDNVPATKGRRRLLDDENLRRFLDEIKQSNDDNNEESSSSYSVIQRCNKHSAAVTAEMAVAHADLCAAYGLKFPELEELLVDPVQYRAVVRALGNEPDPVMALANEDGRLRRVLTPNQILTVSVAATSTRGVRLLTPLQMSKVEDCCAYVEQLRDTQKTLTDFVVDKMSDAAPNTCALLGDPTLAATVVGLAGGLAQLANVPACNLQVLGQIKHSASSRAGLSNVGLSSSEKNTTPHAGVLFSCDLVRKCRKSLQKKALKTVAAKLALAARCDHVLVDTGRRRTNEHGLRFREEVERRVAKWEEPDEARVVKALPKPDLATKRRRGGRRMRRLKERFEETELMKRANTRAFSARTGEYGDDAMGLTLGTLDAGDDGAGAGALKRPAPATKLRRANTKASRKRAATMMNTSSTTNGLASSMVFTPVQGLELVNPDADKDRVRRANAKWFSDNTGFLSALPKEEHGRRKK